MHEYIGYTPNFTCLKCTMERPLCPFQCIVIVKVISDSNVPPK